MSTKSESCAMRRLESPVGPLLVWAAGGAVRRLTWADDDLCECPVVDSTDQALLDQAEAQLAAYFSGDLRRFQIPLAPAGTPFQRHVWQEMSAIPFGRTRTYGDLAHTLDSAPRAIGQACGANPIPILIPCHRVVAGGRRLGGFSGGMGAASKRALLAHEQAVPDADDLLTQPAQAVTETGTGR